MAKKKERKTGRVIAVCRRATPGLQKTPDDQIVIGLDGVEGDYHAGPERVSRRTGMIKENDRQVSIVAQEVLDDLHHRLGIEIPPGGFGENILVEGVGDLSDLAGGDRICFDDGVIVEVTEQNEPCAHLNVWHKRVLYEAIGRRGIVGTVKKGGTVRPGDRLVIKARVGRKR